MALRSADALEKTALFDEVSTDIESGQGSDWWSDDGAPSNPIARFRDAPDEFKVPWCMANRVALWVGGMAILALYFGRHALASMHLNFETILMNILFQVGADLGSTVDNVLHGTVGTFYAALAIYVLRGFFPDGYDGTNPKVFWIGATTLVLYILVFMFVNIRSSVRFFALITFVGYGMGFLDPHANGDQFSTSFRLSWQGAEANTFGLYIVAGFLSIGIMLVPCPQPNTALRKSQEIVNDVSKDLVELQLALLQYYFGEVQSLQAYEIQNQFDGLHEKLTKAASYHDASWYESLGFSKSRLYIKDLIEMLDRTVSLYQPLVPIVAREDFSKTHGQRMHSIQEPLSQLTDSIGILLVTCSACAVDGRIDQKERRRMDEAIGKIAPKVDELHNTLRQTGQNAISQATLSLHHYVYTASAVAEEARDHAAKILVADPVGDTICAMTSMKIQQLLTTSRGDFWWAFRTSLSLCVALLCGYVGLCNKPDDLELDTSQSACFVEPYNANLASIQIILMSKLSGSTFKAALSRVSAVMLVSVSGQFFNVTFGWCEAWARLLTGVCVFVVVQIGMFMAYHGGDNSEIGTRLAAIGVMYLMSPCSSQIKTYHSYSDSYHELSDTILGVFIMLFVDTVLGDTPSSQRARVLMIQALSDFTELLDDYLMRGQGGAVTRDKAAAIRDKVAEAKAVGDDALNEPVTWHARLCAPLFTEINTSVMGLTTQLFNLATEIGEDKDVILDALPSFEHTARQIVNAADYTVDLLIDMLVPSRNCKQERLKLMAFPAISGGLQGLDELIKEMNEASTLRGGQTQRLSVRSRRSVIVLSLDTIMHTLHDLQRHAIRSSHK